MRLLGLVVLLVIVVAVVLVLKERKGTKAKV